MSNPFHHTHWIVPLAAKERERRKLIDDFKLASPTFLKTLLATLNADINKFNQEFPGETVTIHINESGDTITCSTELNKAVVQLHSEEQTISCSFGTQENANWRELLEVTSLGLHCKQLAPEHCAKEFSENILKPLLFPAL